MDCDCFAAVVCVCLCIVLVIAQVDRSSCAVCNIVYVCVFVCVCTPAILNRVVD
jgi:hypothetical protein